PKGNENAQPDPRRRGARPRRPAPWLLLAAAGGGADMRSRLRRRNRRGDLQAGRRPQGDRFGPSRMRRRRSRRRDPRRANRQAVSYSDPERRRAWERERQKRRAKRPPRPPAERLRAKRDLAPFVALVSEGCSIGDPIALADKTIRLHRSFLWGACDADGEPQWLY